jgi:hypothetical protein
VKRVPRDSAKRRRASLPSFFFAITHHAICGDVDRLQWLEELRSASALQYAVEPSMKKQELEAILGDGENTPELGPIEDYLDAVATERKLPDFAVGMCTLRINRGSRTEIARRSAAGRGWQRIVGR